MTILTSHFGVMPFGNLCLRVIVVVGVQAVHADEKEASADEAESITEVAVKGGKVPVGAGR